MKERLENSTIILCKIMIVLNRTRILKVSSDTNLSARERKQTIDLAKKSIQFYQNIILRKEKMNSLK